MSKLILTQEVDGLGTAGDIVDVKAGYARNYLLPHGYAVAVPLPLQRRNGRQAFSNTGSW